MTVVMLNCKDPEIGKTSDVLKLKKDGNVIVHEGGNISDFL